MKAICMKKKCVWRTKIENGTYYCPFGKCPFNMSRGIANDRERVKQAMVHKQKNSTD